jgi:hypothetical protein
MWGYVNGAIIDKQTTTPSVDSIHLRFGKCGSTLIGCWSIDGNSWNTIETFTFTTTDPVEVGLMVINAGSNVFSADFDYFHSVPAGVFVIPEYSLGILTVPIVMGGAFMIFKRSTNSKKV